MKSFWITVVTKKVCETFHYENICSMEYHIQSDTYRLYLDEEKKEYISISASIVRWMEVSLNE